MPTVYHCVINHDRIILAAFVLLDAAQQCAARWERRTGLPKRVETARWVYPPSVGQVYTFPASYDGRGA